MPIQHYRKELVSNAFFSKPGQRVNFETLAGNTGVIAVDSESQPEIFAALEAAANAHRLGVVRISGEDYETLKKKKALRVSALNSKPDKLRVFKAFNPLLKERRKEQALEALRKRADVATAGRGRESLPPPSVEAPAEPSAASAPAEPIPKQTTGKPFSPALSSLKGKPKE